jgi:hypothetical protein
MEKTVNLVYRIDFGWERSAVGFVVDTRTKETTFINKVEPLNLLLKVLLKGKFRRRI